MFYRTPSWLLVTSLVIVVTLSACDSSGSAQDDTPPVTSGETISGSVLGSYIVGANICIDENENGRCDTSDTFRTTTTTSGAYSFPDVPDDIFSKPIIVEIPDNASIVDPQTGVSSAVSTQYRLAFPPSSESERFVSSLSTLVNSEFAKSGDLASAKQSVSDILGVGSPDDLLGNYVETAVGDSATEDDQALYNASKLVGNAMRSAQRGTADDMNLDANILLQLVTEKIIENIQTIELLTREANGIMSQEEAEAVVQGIGDLDVTASEISTVEQLASAPFNLGQIKELTINNINEEGQGTWQRQFYVWFELAQPTTLGLGAYKASIPGTYELGLYDDTETLVQAYNFNEPENENSDLKYYYQLRDQGTRFTMFARDFNAAQFAAGDYTFELCLQTCAQSTGAVDQIEIGTKTITAEADAPDLAELVAMRENDEVDLYTSAGDEAVSNGNQVVFVNAPAPAIGWKARVEFGPDANGLEDAEYSPQVSFRRDTLHAFNEIEVPKDEFDSFVAEDLVVQFQVQDAIDYPDVSYLVRTSYQPMTDIGGIERRANFLLERTFDVYSTDIYLDYNEVTQEDYFGFVEGGEISPRLYISDNQQLTNMWFEDDQGAIIGSEICMPSNIPTTQAELASFSGELQHRGDGTEGDGVEYSFAGCPGQDIQSVLNLAPLTENSYSRVRVFAGYSNKYDVEYLDLRVEVLTNEVNGVWSESVGGVDFLRDAHVIALEFNDGADVQRYLLDIPVPEANHDFSLATDDWEVVSCYTENDNLKVGFVPPSWMSQEYNAGELSLRLVLKGYDEVNDRDTERFELRPLRGTKSVIIPARILGILLEDPNVSSFYAGLFVGDMDYYDWKKRTWWSRYESEPSRSDIENFPDCSST